MKGCGGGERRGCPPLPRAEPPRGAGGGRPPGGAIAPLPGGRGWRERAGRGRRRCQSSASETQALALHREISGMSPVTGTQTRHALPEVRLAGNHEAREAEGRRVCFPGCVFSCHPSSPVERSRLRPSLSSRA